MLKKYSNIWKSQVMFTLVAILYGGIYAFFIKHGLSGDSFFHYLNFKDIYLTITQGHWPQFNLHSGYILGSATNTFYPWLIFLPLISLIYVIPPLQWWGTAISIGMLIGLNVSYWVGHKWLHSRKSGIYLALFYCLSTIPFSEIYGQGDLSSYYAMMIAPLAFYGWHIWLKGNHWRLLTFSLVAITYLHVLTAIILIASLSLLTILQCKLLTKKKFYAGLKCTASVICLTSVYWVPVLVLRNTNHIFVPISRATTYIRSQLPFFNWTDFLVPYTANIWCTVTILGLIAIVLHYKYLSRESWCYVSLCILFLLVNNYSISIWLVQRPPFDIVQFMHRLCFVTIFYLSLTLVELGQRHALHFKRYAILIFIFTVPFLLLGAAEKINTNNKRLVITNVRQTWSLSQVPLNYTQSELESTTFLRALPKRYPDYYPKNLVTKHVRDKIPVLHEVLNLPQLKSSPQQNIHLTPSHLIIYSRTNQHVILPVTLYKQQSYRLYDNHRRIVYRSRHHLLLCHVNKGRNVIKIIAPIMWYRYVTMIISVSTLLVLLFRRQRH